MEISEKEMHYATKTFETICEMLTEEEINYLRSDEDLVATMEFDGKDFPLKIVFKVFPEQKLVMVNSPLSFIVPEEGRTNVALALTMLNSHMYDGMWEESLESGDVEFRITNSYYDSIIGKGCFKTMMSIAITYTIDAADKLFMVGKGNMTLQQFCDAVFGVKE